MLPNATLTRRLQAGIASTLLLLAAHSASAQTSATINLTAAPTQTALPDGTTVPMWGYACTGNSTTSVVPDAGGTCAAANPRAGSNWSPVVITVPYSSAGTSLTINLTNQLTFPIGTTGTANNIPTSLMIVGQLGGGLGTGGATAASPAHGPQSVTWNTPGTPSATNTPPAQLNRVQSFGTEVLVGGNSGNATALTWSNLRPGTYLIESGTHPSIQGPMGLYGVLVVTQAPNATAATPGVAYPTTAATNPATYDADVPVVLSEIDAVQNAAVDGAVRQAGFNETTVWSGLAGGCAAPGIVTPNCYPPAVNYSPRYYLVNGTSLDRTNLGNSIIQTLPAGSTTSTGRLLVRLVNAGLRMHVPAFVGLPMTLLAEDGNRLPGVPRVQNEVFLAAGKTYDVSVTPTAASGAYSAATYPLFDRQLSLSTNSQRDGGMQAYVAVAGGATTGVGSTLGAGSGSAAALTVGPKTYYCSTGQTLTVADASRGLLAGSTGANGVALSSSTGLPAGSSLTLQSNGTFVYTPPAPSTTTATPACGGSFTVLVNGTTSVTETITECDALVNPGTGSACLGGAPTLANDSYNATNAKRLVVNPPGVLLNDTDPSGLALKVDLSTVAIQTPGLAVTVNPDGSFTATAPGAGQYAFSYNVRNSQDTAATSSATVTLNFPAGTGLALNVIDQNTGNPVTDYRWIIEEDRTFWVDPKCQVNIVDPTTGARPLDSYGRACPPLPVESIGYNFHTASLPVVATGCVGDVSCEKGQTIGGGGLSTPGTGGNGTPVVCDVGDGICRTSAVERDSLTPDQVALDPNKHYFISVMPGDGINPTIAGFSGNANVCGSDPTAALGTQGNYTTDFAPGTGRCGHGMGGAQIPPQYDAAHNYVKPSLTISVPRTPLPPAQIAVLVYEDDYPLNGENDAGGGVDILAPFEPGLEDFQIVLLDQGGGLADSTGQITYDMFNMPVSNSLAGTIDPMTNQDACPLTSNKNAQGKTDGLIGMIVVCPKFEADGTTLSPLAGQALIKNLYPGLYEVAAYPGATRIARGEEWLQTNTLDGGRPHEAFIRPGEPAYFQEFGPGGFHVQIGFANPAIINARRTNALGTGICDSAATGGGGLTCTSSITGQVHGNHMSRTPDERTYDTESYDAFKFSACYVSIGVPDAQDFAFTKCDQNGNFSFSNIPDGTYKMAVFDQWNDIMLDGLITAVSVSGTTKVTVTATQWRTNLYTRTYLDDNHNGIPDRNADGSDKEAGLATVPVNIRYRDGSIGFKTATDPNGYATFNEVFPLMNWLVVEADTTRFKPTGEHVVYDAGGPDDCTSNAVNCSKTASHLAGTAEYNSLPVALRVPGAVYCTDADCSLAQDSIQNGTYYKGAAGSSGPNTYASTTLLSSGRIDPPWTTEGYQGLLGQHNFIDFGMKPFVPGENGGINGLVVYSSTRAFDDPTQDVQSQWEPAVPNVRVNLYKKTTAPDGSTSLTLVDSTLTSSWDAYAQGFRTTGDGKTLMQISGTNNDAAHTPFSNAYVPNVNCPGQDPTSGFFATLQGSKMWLDTADATGNKKSIAYNAQFKCFDGWSVMNQIQPAVYDGRYTFPSVVDRDPVTGRPSGTGSLNGVANTTGPAGTNCTICVKNPDDGNPMLPAGVYVVETVTPEGWEIVKEEDKNILMGDAFTAPVSQQIVGILNIFILPDQATMNAYFNPTNPVNPTSTLGIVKPSNSEYLYGFLQIWPCAGAVRQVPDVMSLFPAVGQTAPFAGAYRPLCDRKEITLQDQMTAKSNFFIYTKNHIAGHFTGTMTNDMASEFDPFSPQFGEKFGVPNLPVRLRDFNGQEVTRVYGDQWGIYNGVYFSSWDVNPPNPTGFAPQMSIACMNDPGPVLDTNPASATYNTMITDPAYNPAYSNFCYEQPFMPGFTTYMDTPVTPVQAFADHYNLPDIEYPDGTPVIRRADFTANSIGGKGPWADNLGEVLTLTAFGDRVVQNPQYTGPSGASLPYANKTTTRHYGFGAYCSAAAVAAGTNGCRTVSQVTIGGLPATVVSTGGTPAWTDTQIQVQLPAQLPNCRVQQHNSATSRCGEVVITAGNGRSTFDAVTVMVGGRTPKLITPSSPSSTVFGEFYANPVQTAIDAANPGDVIILDTGTYRENLIMWKPIRLQGVGAGSVTINADAHPAGKMDAWRRRMTCLFGLTVDGVPNVGNAKFDPSGAYTCPANMYFAADRLPYEGFVGWDATSNGNLAQVLQEPSLMGAYEGAGVTVVGRGVNQTNIAPVSPPDYWGQGTGGGTYPNGARYLTQNDCGPNNTGNPALNYYTGNFQCNPSAIDGLTIINSSQGGGGIYMHGWTHNLEVANNRINSNAGTLSGGVNLGQGEKPSMFTLDNVTCGNTGANPAPLCPPIPPFTPVNGPIPFQFQTNVHVHHNQVVANASIGDALFSGVPSGAGGIGISSGSENYEVDHNWIAGNLTSGDGGGIAHMGTSFNGSIHNNYVLFNQANNPTLPVDGGGIIIMGAQEDRTLANGQECGGSTDVDCPPGIGEGTGFGVKLDSNLVLGNSAEDGSGGGIRLRQVNGDEMVGFLNQPTRWYDLTLTNNIVVNNVAGWDGAGVSLQDAFRVSIINNTIASNDTTASAGVLFKTLGAIGDASPPPGCIPTPDPTQPQAPGCLENNGPHIPQPAGVVTMQNTPNMMAQFTSTVVCPAGFGYGDANDTLASRTNGRCVLVGLPNLTNDLIWQNRAFHVAIVNPDGTVAGTGNGTTTPTGTGVYSHQNLVALLPYLDYHNGLSNQQSATGQCGTPTDGSEIYWDVGVRMDALPNPNGHNLVFNAATVGTTYGVTAGVNAADSGPIALTARNSILSDSTNLANVVSQGSIAPAATPIVGQYCNGARVPPEQCSVGQGATNPAMCRGYFTPAGQSETAGISQVFLFNGIAASATVDEGNNWINMTYGPLTLSRPLAAGGSTPTELLSTSGSVGAANAAYTLAANSPAIWAGSNAGSPGNDFFGQPRPAVAPTIGAVEYQPGVPTLTAISPASGMPGDSYVVTLTGTNLTPATTLAAVRVTPAGAARGLNITNVTWVSTTQMTATFAVAANSALGTLNVTATNIDGTSNPVVFTVANAVPPTVTAIAPASTTRPLTGTKRVPVTITGTNFAAGGTTVAVTGGPGVTVDPATPVVVNGTGTSLTAALLVTSTAAIGPESVTVSTAAGTSGPLTFTVIAPPTLTSVSPNAGTRGQAVNVTFTGTGLTGTSAVVITGGGGNGPRITVTNLAVVSDTSVTATLTIAGNAGLGGRTLALTTPNGNTNTVAFTVNGPALTGVNPATGVRGTQVAVTLTGTGLTGATGLTFGGNGGAAALTVVAGTFKAVNDTTVTATINIPATAALGGGHTISVQTPIGATGTVGFTVTGATLTGITPNSATHPATGTLGVAVTLTGTNLTGATTLNFGGGTGLSLAAGSLKVVSSTTVTATVNVAANASISAGHTISVQTPIGATGTVNFTVQ